MEQNSLCEALLCAVGASVLILFPVCVVLLHLLLKVHFMSVIFYQSVCLNSWLAVAWSCFIQLFTVSIVGVRPHFLPRCD